MLNEVVIDVIGHWCGPRWSLHNYGVDFASTRCVLSIPPETIVKEALELQIFSSEVEAPIVATGKEEKPQKSKFHFLKMRKASWRRFSGFLKVCMWSLCLWKACINKRLIHFILSSILWTSLRR